MSQPPRFCPQITAVCNFFTYVRYIQQGLVRQEGERPLAAGAGGPCEGAGGPAADGVNLCGLFPRQGGGVCQALPGPAAFSHPETSPRPQGLWGPHPGAGLALEALHDGVSLVDLLPTGGWPPHGHSTPAATSHFMLVHPADPPSTCRPLSPVLQGLAFHSSTRLVSLESESLLPSLGVKTLEGNLN